MSQVCRLGITLMLFGCFLLSRGQDTLLASEKMLQAVAFEKKGDYPAAIQTYEEALPFYKQAQMPEAFAQHCFQLARMCYRVGEVEKMEQYIQEADHTLADFSPYHPLHVFIWRLRGQYAENQQRNYPNAFQAYQTSHTLALKAYGPDHLQTYIAHRHLGMAHVLLAHYGQAESILLPVAKQIVAVVGPNHKQTLEAYNSIGFLYYYQSRFSEALQQFKKVANVIEAEEGHETATTVYLYSNLGACYFYLAQYDLAVEALTDALANCQQTTMYDRAARISILLNLGINYQGMGHYPKAIAYAEQVYQESLDHFGPQNEYAAQALNNLGLIYMDLGAYRRAKAYIQEAKLMLEGIYPKNHYNLAKVYANLGITCIGNLDQPNLEEARGYFQRAFDIHRQNKAMLAQIREMINLGTIMIYAERLGEAKEWLAEAYQLLRLHFDAGADTLAEMSAYHHSQARIALKEGRPQQAIEELEPYTLAWASRHGLNQADLTVDYHLLAEAYGEIGDFSAAYEQLGKAAATYLWIYPATDSSPAMQLVTNPLAQLETAYLRGKLLRMQYELTQDTACLQQGFKVFQTCDQLIQELIQMYRTYQEDPLSQQDLLANIYEEALRNLSTLIQLDPRPSYFEQAFYFIEQNKSNALLQSLNHDFAIQFAGLPDSLVDKEYELTSLIGYYKERMMSSTTAKKVPAFQRYQQAFLHTQRAYDSLIHHLEATYPKYYQLKYPQHDFSLEKIQSQISKGKVLLAYFWGKTQAYLFWLTSEQWGLESLPDPTGVAAQIEAVRSQTQQAQAYVSDHEKGMGQQLHGLFLKLLGPLPNQILDQTQELCVIPDGPLGNVSFDMLLTEAPTHWSPGAFKAYPYLIKSHCISYVYSARLLDQPWSQRPDKQKRYAGFAPDYDFYTALPEKNAPANAAYAARSGIREQAYYLPFARQSVSHVSEIWDGDAFLGNEATEASFKAAAQDYDILHLAMHGWVAPDQPMQSGLLFGTATDSLEDNLLTISELYGMSLDAHLVVLGACNTASGTVKQGEGILSLARAFAYAGSPSMIGSLWSVPDAATGEIMQAFFGNLKAGMAKDEALREAKLSYLTKHPNSQANPFFWAGFIPIGEMDPINNLLAWHWGSWVLGGLTLLIGLLIWAYRRGEGAPNTQD